jgi:hypothetical protein
VFRHFFPTTEISLSDRDHAKLWIATHQLGRRNLTDDQRADIANEVREIRATILNNTALAKAREAKANPAAKPSVSVKSADTAKPDSRKAIAAEAKLPERKIRLAQEIKKVDPVVSAMVRAGDISLVEGRKIVSLTPEARQIAVKAVETSIKNDEDVDVRADIVNEVREIRSEIGRLRLKTRLSCPTSAVVVLSACEVHIHAQGTTRLQNWTTGNASTLSHG